MNDTLVDKVRKLLAMAEATDNPNEAEAFSAKAATLIAAHRLDVAHVRESLTAGDLGLRRVALGRGAYVRARLALLSAVAHSHDCEVVFETGPEGTIAVIAGYSTDLAVTGMLYESLHIQAASQLAAVKRPTPAATQRWRRSFLLGYATKVGELLAKSRASATAPARPDGQPTLFDGAPLPDLLERSARVKEFAARSFGRVVKARPTAPAIAAGWNHGQRAANSADLGRNRLTGRRALGRGAE